MHDIPILHDVRLAFQAIDAVAFGFFHGAEAFEVGVADDFGAHEAAREVVEKKKSGRGTRTVFKSLLSLLRPSRFAESIFQAQTLGRALVPVLRSEEMVSID